MLKVEELRELVKIVDQSTIAEFTYETDGTTVTMKKANTQAPQSAELNSANTGASSQMPAVEAETEDASEDSGPQTDQPEAAHFDHEIVSPMVGTFYTRPEPESDAYVNKGSKVANETVVGMVEAMKLFNEIEAEVNGEITEILVDDGELVEYGQPLFRVKTK